MNDRHVALIIEDDPKILADLKWLVTSMGHGYLVATTLEEVRAAMAAGGYCYVLLDMQFPPDGDSNASVGCGETALLLLRRAHPQRAASGKHALPVIVVTGYSQSADFVSKVYEMDASGFIVKPFGPFDLVLDKIRAALARSEREDHAACGAVSASPSRAPPAGPMASEPPTANKVDAASIRIRIDGSGMGERTFVFVNDKRVAVQDSTFADFFRLLAVHKRGPGTWASRDQLGLGTKVWATSRVRTAFAGALPEGAEMVETWKGKGFRLNPAVVVERVEAEALRQHAEASVRKIAGEWGKT